MEELKNYAIYIYEENRIIEYPEEQLLDVVCATESEVKELCELLTWDDGIYGNTRQYCRYEEYHINRLDFNDYKICIENAQESREYWKEEAERFWKTHKKS